jgi:predicted ArsR family transcriptional regulator
VRRAARDLGQALGREARAAAGPRAGRPTLLRRLDAVLRRHGYEPFRAPDRSIRLRNCPFDALARDHRPLVCGMNHELLDGIVRGLGVAGCRAVLDPRPGGCCVALHTGTTRR